MLSGNLQQVLKVLNQSKKKQTVLGRNIEFNRKILEHKNTSCLVLNHKSQTDSLYQRNSGLNHILCKIAKKNSITFIIDFRELLKETNKLKQAKILSKIIQNIKLIKKFKNKLKIIGMPKHEASSLLLTLNLPTNIIKKALK